MTRRDRVRGMDLGGNMITDGDYEDFATVDEEAGDAMWSRDDLMARSPPGTGLTPWKESAWKSRLRDVGAATIVILFAVTVWYCAVATWHNVFPAP